MKKNLLIIALIIIVLASYFVLSRDNKVEPDNSNEVKNNITNDLNESQSLDKNADIKSGDEQSSYQIYSEDKISLAENGKAVIFFQASWCPSCRALNNDIEKNIDSIPSDVTILKADYDKETELKKKYGVTSQHTLVQVDKDGNLIQKWSGGSNLESILSKIN
jgi:thiol-disulfide isomerase/thioredoxin